MTHSRTSSPLSRVMTEAPARPRLLMPEDLGRPFRYATRRNPQLRTRGGKVATLAAALGRPLKPHQQYIADVGTELAPPGSRHTFRYQKIVINEPRQVGKTTLLRPLYLDRCLWRPNTSTFMTAQKGKDAGERWADLVQDLEHSPFGQFATIKRGKGDQSCTFPNQSFISPFAPVRDGLHGESPDLVSIDEGWAFTLEGGRDVMRAVRPAMITRTARQLWILSAAGTADSEWWDEEVEAGRASVNDPSSTTAYFEHSADEDLDPYDPETWQFHPGLDGLITSADLAEEAKPENNTHADFLRGFLNRPTKVRDNTVVDLPAWDALAWETPPALPDQVAIAYDVAIDRTAASVWQAWRDPAGTMNLAVLRSEADADWLPDYVAQLHRDTGITPAADDGGPARAVTDALTTRGGIPVDVVTGTSASTAWSAMKGNIKNGTVRHDGSPTLRAGLEVAVERPVGDALALSRRYSLGPIDAPIAATTASWAADRLAGIQLF